VFTPVGLLPIAAAGVDVDEFMAGAEAVCNIFADKEAPQHEEYVKYPVSRLLLGQQGKAIEAFEYYEPCLRYFAEWLKQIFGESEGKDGKGIFPAAVRFSTELHSMGQFLQDGSPIFFETVLDVKKPPMDLVVPMQIGKDATATSMNLVNRAACEGTIAAHVAVGTPVGIVEIPELTPFYMGQVLYFFEMSCAVSGMLHEVNPFDQPGVEAYKKEMRAYLATLRGEN